MDSSFSSTLFPDLTPTNYHLFCSLSNHLREKKFDDENDVKINLISFFGQKSMNFYEHGIPFPPERWRRFIGSDSVYKTES